MDHPFRSATFGGFNRQDVLAYLESTAKTAEERQQTLQQQLDEARETLRRQEEDLSVQRMQVIHLRQEQENMKSELEQSNLALSASQGECSRKEAELSQLRAELEAARAKIAALEPDAMAYAAIKERTAGMELEAHRRAQVIQEEAEEQARQLRRRMDQWLQKMGRQYDDLRTQVETTVSHAADQLARAGRSLDEVNALMDEQGRGLEDLEQAYKATDPEKVAAPMPLAEE